MKKSNHLLPKLVLTFICVCMPVVSGQESAAPFSDLFNEISGIAEAQFYDGDFIAAKFPAIRSRYLKRLPEIEHEREFRNFINEMLGEFNTSHTQYYSQDQPEYYQLAAIFQRVPVVDSLFNHTDVTYATAGILTRQIGDNHFIYSVLSGSAADSAGLLAGDEILSVNSRPFEPFLSLKDFIGRTVMFKILRSADGLPQDIPVTVQAVNPKTEFLEAEKASISIIETSGFKIGYIHIWSYAGEEYHRAFTDAIAFGALKDADALIWDLRYGWGGANPSYLDVFNRKVPVLNTIDRDGGVISFDQHWRKPAVMLADGTVRSGKEVLAYGFKKYGFGKIIGENTAGAVVAGRINVLSNGALLYLASRNALVDGEVLEGTGVAPDIHVPMNIRYLQGKDLQKDAAIDYLEKLLTSGKN